MPTLRQLVVSAIRSATPSVEALAHRLGLSTSALRRYRQGNRTPSDEIVQQLASELRRQAAQLLEEAERLEGATTKRRSDA